MLLSALPWRSKPSAPRRDEAPVKPLRQDIQGLRAVAVGIVLLFHAGVPWLPGGFVGVDVFFVISGFLITGGIVKEIRRDGKLSLKNFYIRRIARILPAATLALVGTAALAWALLPSTRWAQAGSDLLASALYYVNWLFAGNAVDYMAQDGGESPAQHFWSLAVEEQYYVVWPLVLMAVGFLSLKLNFRLQRGMLVALAMIAVPSLAWSVIFTAMNPGSAYFVTTTRAWELAVGAFLAIIAGRVKDLPKVASIVLGWAGLAAIVFSALTYTKALPFPSYTALLPVLGAAAVIWAGRTAGSGGPVAALGLRPMIFTGNLSYSLYLWHWPLLVIAAGAWGKLDPIAGLAVVALAFIPAWISLVLVERPAQAWLKDTRGAETPFLFGLSLTAIGATIGLLLMLAVPPVSPPSSVSFTPSTVAGVAAKPIGAELLFNTEQPLAADETSESILPAPVQAKNDLHAVNAGDCMQNIESTEARQCVFGKQDGAKTLALVGDSHAAMFVAGFEKVALENNWKLVTYTKGACPWIDVNVNYANKPFTQCREWVGAVSAALHEVKPDVIVTSMSRYRTNDGVMDQGEASDARLVEAMQETWSPFINQGIRVLSIRDTPRPGVAVPDCVEQNMSSGTLGKCAVPRSESLLQSPPEVVAANYPGASLLDMTDAFCFGEACPAVIGGVLVYRDDNHITATYSASLHKHIGEVLAPLMGPTP